VTLAVNMLREARTRYLQLRHARRVTLALDRAIVSFTFDDVPRSALVNGVPLLEQAGINATFYVAMGLGNAPDRSSDGADEGYLRPEDVAVLHRQGHHIACHTYSHYRLSTGSVDGLVADAQRNVALLEELLDGHRIRHFSYPFGEVSFPLKRRLSSGYDTLRSSRPGINAGTTDLNLLRAISIYDPLFDRALILDTISHAVRAGGWLIFYTHGVHDRPDSFSCTPSQLAWVIDQCMQQEMLLLPVSSAYEAVTATNGFRCE